MSGALQAKPKVPWVMAPVLWLFLLAYVMANLGGAMFYPLLPLYLKSMNTGISEIGLYYTLSAIMPLLLQIFGGWVSDRLGRLRAVAIGSLGGALGWAGILFAPSWGWLLICQSVQAIATAFVMPSVYAFIAEMSAEEHRGKVFAVSQCAMQLIVVLAPVSGGLIVKSFGWKPLIYLSATLYFSATVLRLLMAKRFHSPAVATETGSCPAFVCSFREVFCLAASGGILTWILLSSGVKDTAMGFSMSLLPVFLQEMRHIGVASLGMMHSISGIAAMLVMIPAGHWADRWGKHYLIAGGYFLGAVAFILLLTIPKGWMVGLCFGIYGLGVGMLQPAYQSLISQVVPDRLRGIAFGVLSTNSGLVSLPSPWIGSLLWKSISPAAPFWLSGLAMLIMAPLALWKLKTGRVVKEG